MARILLIKLHLYFSAFFSAAIVLVALSGGLYLIGIKGSVDQQLVGTVDMGEALLADPSHARVAAALSAAGVTDFEFDYVNVKGTQLVTRPTSRPFYSLTIDDDQVTVRYSTPTLQKRMIELHMGHGLCLQDVSTVFCGGYAVCHAQRLMAGVIVRSFAQDYIDHCRQRIASVHRFGTVMNLSIVVACLI